MGRLFWKFFVLFWLAQVMTTVTIGMVIWIDHRDPNFQHSFFLRPPPPPPSLYFLFEKETSQGLLMRPSPPKFPVPALPIVMGGFVSLIFAAILAWYVSKPIHSLKLAFQSVSKGKLHTRIAQSMGRRDDELSDLGKDFDQMASRLESLVESQQSLLHDVSHELRSPLARIQAASDLIQQQPDRTVEFVQRIEKDTMRMNTLVGELLTLARIDSVVVGNPDELVNLHDMLSTITEDALIEAEQKHCSIRLDVAESIFIHGSQELLIRAFENIVRNAVRYTNDLGSVNISTSVQDGFVITSIDDSGSGVVGLQVNTIFEPFVRANIGSPNPGYGLGLAITKKVIESHGGSVSAKNGNLRGLIVSVRLPLAATSSNA